MAKDYAKYRNSRSRAYEGGGSWRWLLALILIGLFAALVLFLKQQSIKMAEEQTNKALATAAAPAKKTTSTTTSNKNLLNNIAAKNNAVSPSTINRNPETPQNGGSPQPRFDFYTMLPQGQNAAVKQAAPAPSAPASPIFAPLQQAPNAPTAQSPTASTATSTNAVASPTTGNPSNNKNNVVAAETETAQFLQSELSTKPNTTTTPTKTVAPQPVVYVLELGLFKTFSEADALKAQLILEGLDVKIKTVRLNNLTLYRVYTGSYSSLGVAQQAQRDLLKNQVKSKILKD